MLERATEPREVGAGLTLMANALRGLDALGLGPAVRRGGAAPGGVPAALAAYDDKRRPRMARYADWRPPAG
ncbi:hypothetical protein ABZU25_29160 [Micromonospora sp. NPDC005215]|uniref:hypothetical protein n=1 Tax=Micromonospora sp. NPDC005215 TaxID=3157024 RepID=UPI0033AB3BE0